MASSPLPRSDMASETMAAVLASMQKHGIARTADNFLVWEAYLSGSNPALKRAVDAVLSNGVAVDERAMRALYASHFRTAREAFALRDTARRSIATLQNFTGQFPNQVLAESARIGVELLSHDLQLMIEQSEKLALQLDSAERRISLLERFLSDARLEATTDGLTGVANRRAFDEALRSCAGDSMNDGADLSFLLIDIDHFKQVNDVHGHPAGDDVLRSMAAILMRTVRGGDLVARYGGEEFAIILPKTGPAGAMAVAENLRAAVAASPAHVLSAETRSNLALHITISAGISCYDHGEPLAAWLARADAALYQAKSQGRNRVIFGEPPAS